MKAMLRQAIAAVRFAVLEFGGLIAFWVLSWRYGTRAAIAGTLVFLAFDVSRRLIWRVSFDKLYLFSNGLVVVFGAIDLVSKSPFMLRFESPITNFGIGVVFALGAFGRKPLIQAIAETRAPEPFPDDPDVRRFFQIFTLIWAAYFVVKAGVYLWIGLVLPLSQAMAVRTVVGLVSLGAMMLVSTQGRLLWRGLRRIGLLHSPLMQAE